MKQILSILLSLFMIYTTIASVGQKITICGNITVWYETFGNPHNPPMLLVMENGPGMFWHTSFCEQLAEKGFYVIRYNHRNTGQSTHVATKNDNLARDAIFLLEALGIEKAHICGASIGSIIAEIIASQKKITILSLALIGVFHTLEPFMLALQGKAPNPELLSGPHAEYFSNSKKTNAQACETSGSGLDKIMNNWRLLNGSTIPLDEAATRTMLQACFDHGTVAPDLNSYFPSIKMFHPTLLEMRQNITAPTLIFHGSEDPLAGPDHAIKVAQDIPKARACILEGMGHIPNPVTFPIIIKDIVENSGINPLRDDPCKVS